MSDLRKAAQKALTILDGGADICPASMEHKALRAALAQPEPEPVAVWELFADGWDTIDDSGYLGTLPVGTKLYASPPQRQPLTDAEIDEVTHKKWGSNLTGVMIEAYRKYARAVEAKIGGQP